MVQGWICASHNRRNYEVLYLTGHAKFTCYAGGLLNAEVESRANPQTRSSRIERAVKELAESGQPKRRKLPAEARVRG